jgi:hypothetical protein
VPTSTANSTYNRRSNTVSTAKKSTARTLSAWACRNCRQVTADRIGARSTPAWLRMDQTVLGTDLVAQPHSSPWILRYPQVEFSLAGRSTRLQTSAVTDGRPRRLGKVHR